MRRTTLTPLITGLVSSVGIGFIGLPLVLVSTQALNLSSLRSTTTFRGRQKCLGSLEAFASPRSHPASCSSRSQPRSVPAAYRGPAWSRHQTLNGGTSKYALHAAAATAVSAIATGGISATILGNFYMLLLALQFAFQPILTQAYAPANSVVKSTYVLALEIVRFTTTFTLLVATGSWGTATANWNLLDAIKVVGIPAILYLIQNYCSLMAYQNLSPITYNVLNQTKTLSAAVFCYMLMGQIQSRFQTLALLILLLSALVMESIVPVPFLSTAAAKTASTTTTSDNNDNKSKTNDGTTTDTQANRAATRASKAKSKRYIIKGIIPILSASLISGLAGAWVQKSLGTRNSLLFSMELAVISMTMLMISGVFRSFRPRNGNSSSSSTQSSSTTSSLAESSSTTTVSALVARWTKGWTIRTWIPVITNATGGILVGLVTKYAGAVRKGFALILGMFLSGLLQNYFMTTKNNQSASTSSRRHRKVTAQQWVGGALAALSLWMHASFPVTR